MKKYAGDFETSTWEDKKTRVWAWAVSEIGNSDNIIIDNNIDSFFDFCKKENNCVIYFQNLKFDGEFIIHYLLTNNYKHITDINDRANNTFTTLISSLGQFYSITVYFKVYNKKVKKVTFLDSLKIIPFSVDDTAKSFGLPLSKLKLDYNKPRKIGHLLTKHEKDYITHDVKIMSLALEQIFSEELTKMTRASNALHDYKKIIGDNKFNMYFPKLSKEVDTDIRQAYRRRFYLSKPNLSRKRSR